MKQGQGIQPMDVALVSAQLAWSTTLMFVPTYTMRVAGPAAWLSVVVAAMVGLIMVAIAIAIGAKPGTDLFLFMEAALGRWLGKAATLLLTLYFLLMAAADIRAISEFFVGAALPQVPVPVLLIITGAIATLAVRPGPEALCRINSTALAPALLVAATIPLALGGKLRPEYLLPVLGNGPLPILQGGFAAAGWLTELIILAVFLPHTSLNRPVRTAAYAGLAVGFVALQLILVCCLLVFGADLAGQMYKPADVLVTAMSLGSFGERVDMVLVAAWHPAAVLRISLALYATVLGVARLGGLREHRPLVLLVGASAILLSDWSWDSLMELVRFGWEPWPPFSLLVGLGLPALALAATGVRRWLRPPAGGKAKGAPPQ